MANDLYANTHVEFDLDPKSRSRTQVESCISYLSDSTFCETEFENLDSAQSDRYGDYTHLPKTDSNTHDAALYDNDVIRTIDSRVTSVMNTRKMKNKDHFMRSQSQHSVLYGNEDLFKEERRSVAPRLPKRKNRGQKIVHRISTIPSSVRHEIQGWPRLKMFVVSLISILVGAGLVIGGFFLYNFVVAENSAKNTNKESGCQLLKSLGDCNTIPNNTGVSKFTKFTANCSKILKKTINDQSYVVYGDRVSINDAMDFCYRVVHWNMLSLDDKECKILQNQPILSNEDTAYWIGEWCRHRKDNTSSCWQRINPGDDIQVSDLDGCVYGRSKIRNTNETCIDTSNCIGKKLAVCKC